MDYIHEQNLRESRVDGGGGDETGCMEEKERKEILNSSAILSFFLVKKELSEREKEREREQNFF